MYSYTFCCLLVINIHCLFMATCYSLLIRLPLLKALDVSFNLITSIPEEIGSVTSLVK